MYDRLSASGAQSSAQDAARAAGWTASRIAVCARVWARAKASSEAVRTGWALSSSYDSGIGHGFRDLRTTRKGGEGGARSERVALDGTPSSRRLSRLGGNPFWQSASLGDRRAPTPPKTACRLRGIPRRAWGRGSQMSSQSRPPHWTSSTEHQATMRRRCRVRGAAARVGADSPKSRLR